MKTDYSKENFQIEKKIRVASSIIAISGTIAIALLISIISIVIGCEIGKKIQSEKECVIKVLEP